MVLLVLVFGLIAGSFLNVCIYRLPRKESIIKPPSHCPACEKNILWYDNIPVLSFIILGGRCRFCKEKILYTYPLVEALAGLIAVILFIKFGLSVNFLIYSALFFGLLVATFIDLKYRVIPDQISIGGLVVGLVLSLVWPKLHDVSSMMKSLTDAAAGLLIGGGTILWASIVGKFLFKKEAMGQGDVVLLSMIGTFIGWKKVLLTFFIAPFLGIFFAVYTMIKYKDHYSPYGPFLSLAAFVSVLFGDKIIKLLCYGL